jgi:hypothetical protein
MTNPLRAVMSLVTGARDAVGKLREADASLRAEDERAQNERVLLLSQLAPREDVLQVVDAIVDAFANRWRQENAKALVAALGGLGDGLHGRQDRRPQKVQSRAGRDFYLTQA